ncbi:hypothetical protein BUALT_Bualt08G0027100 [Buddleja alternifolia]|uniref:Uncharacterized protein n=1 Tax=Buddleja alternifolia TaxID=168488 RepID=A0AAV6X2H5_9LAMI|nr:hypothetical protein BUALT_Bualt08G0027100 [Buddleja alternifolia]
MGIELQHQENGIAQIKATLKDLMAAIAGMHTGRPGPNPAVVDATVMSSAQNFGLSNLPHAFTQSTFPKVPGLPKAQSLGYFLHGLDGAIRSKIWLFDPQDLMSAMNIARSIEADLQWQPNGANRLRKKQLFGNGSGTTEQSSFARLGETTAIDRHRIKCPPAYVPDFGVSSSGIGSRSENPERLDSVVSFFKESGFSNTQLEKIVKYKPELLLANVEKIIKPKFNVLHDLGLSASEICSIISSNPAILRRSINNRIIPSLSVLMGLIGSNASVAKLLRVCSWFLVTDLDKTMVPNFEFLKSCGIPMNLITQHIYYYPRFILHKPDTMRKSVDKADELGVNRSSNRYITAVGVVSSLSNDSWELKLKTFRDFGFSEDEILGVFRKAPQVFSVSEEKLRNVIGLLLATGRYNTLSIVRYPKSLMYSIETRYKPRLHVLEILEKKNLIENWPSLGAICKPSDKKFFGKFSGFYLDEISEIYMGRLNSVAKKS